MKTSTLFRAAKEARHQWLMTANWIIRDNPDEQEALRNKRWRQLRTFEIEFDRRMDHYDKIRKELP